MPDQSEADWQQILLKDKILANLIQQQPKITLQPHEDIYLSLLSSIISQQLSTKVARVIKSRFLTLFPEEIPVPELVLMQPDAALRQVGLSFQKMGYIRNVATFAQAGNLNFSIISQLKDEALIAHLTQIKGVGRWTVEMILMFTLARPDVFPVDDLGLQNAIKINYGLTLTGKSLKTEMIRIAENWRPYRTYASRYLWQWLDNN